MSKHSSGHSSGNTSMSHRVEGIGEKVSTLAKEAGSKVEEIASKAKHSRFLERSGERVESITSRIPSSGILVLAFGAMLASLGIELFARQRKETGNFVGMWVPTILLFGLYGRISRLSKPLTLDKPRSKAA